MSFPSRPGTASQSDGDNVDEFLSAAWGGSGGSVGSRRGRHGRTQELTDRVGEGSRRRSPAGLVVGGLVGEGEKGPVAVAQPGHATPGSTIWDGLLLEVGIEEAAQGQPDAEDVVGRDATLGVGGQSAQHDPVAGDQYVFGSQGAVDDPEGVQVGDGRREVGDQGRGALGPHRADRGQGPGPT
jgi:hypothetical protein